MSKAVWGVLSLFLFLSSGGSRLARADAVKEGIEHGRKTGNRAVNLFLRPVH